MSDKLFIDCDQCKGTGYSYVEIISHGLCDYESKFSCNKCGGKGHIEVVKKEELDRLRKRVEEIAIIAYECGHNDTVESNYCDPEERVREIIKDNP